jgi:hypothetical protein
MMYILDDAVGHSQVAELAVYIAVELIKINKTRKQIRISNKSFQHLLYKAQNVTQDW